MFRRGALFKIVLTCTADADLYLDVMHICRAENVKNSMNGAENTAVNMRHNLLIKR